MPSVIKLISGFGFGDLSVLFGICFERAGWHWLTAVHGLLDQLIEQQLQEQMREGHL